MTFDPDSFMSETIDAAGSTEFELIPAGDWQAMIDDFQADKAFRTMDHKDGTGTFTTFAPPFSITSPEVLAQMGRDKVVAFHKGMFLDFDENGKLDMSKGKNVDLNQLRDAVGQNVAGQPWNPGMLRGAGPVMIRVAHETDKNNPQRKFARVTRVAKIS